MNIRFSENFRTREADATREDQQVVDLGVVPQWNWGKHINGGAVNNGEALGILEVGDFFGMRI